MGKTISLGCSPYCSRRSDRAKGNRAKLVRLFHEQQGRCTHCGKQLQLPVAKKMNKSYHDTATLDHVYDRFDIRRALAPGLVVLACHSCNHHRGIENSRLLWKGYSYKPKCVSIIKLWKGLHKFGIIRPVHSPASTTSQVNKIPANCDILNIAVC
jgi:hypothetical protein